MLLIHNGLEYNVTNKFTLEQLLKYGAVEVKKLEPKTVTEEMVEEKKEREPRKYSRKK